MIDVIVPFYKGERFVSGFLEVANKIPNINLIFIDNNSPDQTRKLLEQNCKAPFQMLSERRQGVAHARNRGLQATTNEWISFWDLDDRWSPNKIQTQLEIAKLSNADFVNSGFVTDKETLNPQITKEEKWIARKPIEWVFPDNLLSTSGVMIKRSLVGATKFDPNFKISSDWKFWLDLAIANPHSVWVSATQPLFFYNVQGGSLSHGQPIRRMWYQLKLLRKGSQITGQSLGLSDYWPWIWAAIYDLRHKHPKTTD